MRVTFCDACGDECELGSVPFEPKIHIVEKDNGYVDMDWKAVSGRTEHYDLCHECYNDVFTVAMNEFKRIRSQIE